MYIPNNEEGIKQGDYTINGFVKLMRDNKHKSDVVQFLSDMLKESNRT